ncbi:MAG: hypothetical protein GC187_07555 [Alphaproteobacteria bacterium]|nr:hypothetical protein [Alphaproteobacteria bacterium]
MTGEATVRERLTALTAEVEALSRGAAGDRRPVELDQHSVGRLSQQDSLALGRFTADDGGRAAPAAPL